MFFLRYTLLANVIEYNFYVMHIDTRDFRDTLNFGRANYYESIFDEITINVFGALNIKDFLQMI
jgi:hypothetical protein